MKHIDKILPLSILAISFMLVVINIHPPYIVAIDWYIINSNATTIGLNILGIIILLILIILSYIKKINFQRKYSVYTVLALIIISVVAFFYTPLFYTYNSRYCEDEKHYLVDYYIFQPPSPMVHTALAYSDNGIVFKRLGTASHTKLDYHFNYSSYSPDTDLIKDKEIRNKMLECLRSYGVVNG